MGTAQRAYDIQLGRHPLGAEAGADILEGLGVLEFLAGQVGQFEIVEQKIEEFFLSDLEGELIHTFAVRAGLALSGALASAALWLGDGVAGHKFLIAGVHHLPFAALAVVEDRFFNVPGRNTDLLAPFYIGD